MSVRVMHNFDKCVSQVFASELVRACQWCGCLFS
uniref:Uncharacterized protein n=1 Tax=Anguilla anguilla TaxID=7936 RepID=A0A0E9R868_ANGAN